MNQQHRHSPLALAEVPNLLEEAINSSPDEVPQGSATTLTVQGSATTLTVGYWTPSFMNGPVIFLIKLST